MNAECRVRSGERRSLPRGVTLIELLVVLVLLGLIFSVSGVALASLSSPSQSARIRILTAARAQAIRSGVPVVVAGDTSAHGANHSQLPTPVLFLPDGRALGAGVDPFTGAPRAP
ncbi:MAG: prepilin-type N-terminal cleavage/methylation domain-containing protein [Stellaceae bacterium]